MRGAILGAPYRVIELLGEGAMAQVYLAEHVHLGRKEAVKVLRPHIAADASFVSRFRREARATNRLHHPNIVSLYDFGQLADGRFYLSMEYAEGRPVDEILRERGPLPLARVLRIWTQLALAIDHAHARGVVHRDLKPSNLVVAERVGVGDFLKVLDFGMAKIILADHSDSIALTRDGEIFGTPEYMAPEQLLSSETDPRSDIYAVGCIAHELLVGEPPFVGRLIELTHAHANEQPAPPSARNPDAAIPSELDEVVLLCLEKDPSRRFQSGNQLLAALRAVAVAAARRPSIGIGQQELRGDDTALTGATDETLAAGDFGAPAPSAVLDEYTATLAAQATATTSPVDDTASAPSGPPAKHYEAAMRGQDACYERDEDLRESLHEALLELAEALLDFGATDPRLTLSVVNVRALEYERVRNETERNHLQRREAALEQTRREGEGSLRFAIGELKFDSDRAGGQLRADLDSQIRALEKRLADLHADYRTQLDAVVDQAVSLAATRATLEDKLIKAHMDLRALVDEISPQYDIDLSIAPLIDRYQSIRDRMAAL